VATAGGEGMLKNSLIATGTDKQFHSSLNLCNLDLSYNVLLARLVAMTPCRLVSAVNLLEKHILPSLDVTGDQFQHRL